MALIFGFAGAVAGQWFVESQVVAGNQSIPYFDKLQELFPAHVSEQSVESEGTLMTLAEMRHKAVERAEKRYLTDLLTAHKGMIKDSAKTAHISTRQLHKLMKKYSIKKENFKFPPNDLSEPKVPKKI